MKFDDTVFSIGIILLTILSVRIIFNSGEISLKDIFILISIVAIVTHSNLERIRKSIKIKNEYKERPDS